MMIRPSTLFYACVLSITTRAAADDDPSGEAERLFRTGRHAMSNGEYDLACARFAASQSLDPAIGTSLNLSLCEAKRGHLLDARREVRMLLESPRLDERRRSMASRLLSELEQRLGHVRIDADLEAGTLSNVLLDGRALAHRELSTAIPVDPGRHTIDFVSKTGKWKRRVSIIIGESDSVTVTNPGPPLQTSTTEALESSHVPSPTRSPDPVSARPHRTTSRARVVGYAMGGAGIIALAASGTIGYLALRSKRTVDDHCEDRTCDSEGLRASARVVRLGNVATTALAFGVLAIGSGAYLVLAVDPLRSPAPATGTADVTLTAIGRF